MSAHPDVEVLSTYLDRELDRQERHRVEGHLQGCEECRQVLSNLQRVVGDLRALERLAPPPHLGAHLLRLAAVDASRPTLIQRLEQSVARFSQQPTVAPVFALVVALILIIYLFSWGLHRQETGRIPVHLQPEATMGAAEQQPLREIADRTFRYEDGAWVELGLAAESVEESMSGSDPRVQLWLAADTSHQEIGTLGDRVRLMMGNRVVEIRFDDP